jgi:hypothetical protein
MLSKYLSHWFALVFLIWVLSYQLGFKRVARELNPYYITIVFFWGYLILDAYMILIRGFQFETSFLLFKVASHATPLILMLYMRQTSSTNAMRTLLLATALYVIYIKWKGRDLTDSYFKDFYPKSWDDLDKFCVDKPHPVCRIMRFFKG